MFSRSPSRLLRSVSLIPHKPTAQSPSAACTPMLARHDEPHDPATGSITPASKADRRKTSPFPLPPHPREAVRKPPPRNRRNSSSVSPVPAGQAAADRQHTLLCPHAKARRSTDFHPQYASVAARTSTHRE